MARVEEFKVEGYQMITRVGSLIGSAPGYEGNLMIGLFGASDTGAPRRLIMIFLPDGTELPAPVVTEVDSVPVDGTIFNHMSFLPAVLDMMRNAGKHLKAFMCMDDPSFNGISAGIIKFVEDGALPAGRPILPDQPIPFLEQ